MANTLPDNIQALLMQADKQRGFPAGTMASVMQQETGGNTKYIQDPTTYHYGLNAQGKRIAGHTGKISTAFGPFGLLESTGRDPGYGVKPLQGKGLDEQIRFAADYLQARSKQAGGLQAGLSGYGEGGKYGQQVMARLGKGQSTSPAMSAPQQGAAVLPAVVAQPQPQVDLSWQAFQQAQAMKQNQVQEMPMDYSQQLAGFSQPSNAPMPMQMPVVQSLQPNFNRFRAWGKA